MPPCPASEGLRPTPANAAVGEGGGPTRGARLGGVLRAAALAGTLLAVLGCGLKTPPRPLTKVLPEAQGVRAWQRGETLMVAWREPDAATQERFSGYEGMDLRIEPQPELCFTCPRPDPVKHTVAADDPAAARRGGLHYVALPWPGSTERVLVRTRMRFGAGTGPEAPPVFAVQPGRIPAPDLRWRWVGADPAASAPAGLKPSTAVEVYWERPRGGTMQVIGADGSPREVALSFGANLYGRVAPEPWPLLPMNAEPLQVLQWTLPPLRVDAPPQATGREFQLRFVDRFGNEGPPSAIVQIPLPGRRP